MIRLPINWLLLSTLLLCSGCSTTSRHSSIDPNIVDPESYHRQYARFEVSSAALPVFERKIFHRLSGRFDLITSKNRRLELKLGERWSVATNSIYRTESRYRLLDEKGRLLATAESTLALDDRSSDVGEIALLSDSARNSYFIAEEQSWATQRYILIRPAPDAGERPAAWSVRYLRIPLGRSMFGDLPHLLGLHADHLYVEKNGYYYAFPLQMLEQVESLAYPIG